jgi:hypothetical protein
MSKLYLVLCIILADTAALLSQSNYSFTNCRTFTGAYNDISATGTAITMTDPQSGNSTSPQNIGFSFSFNGASYTQFMIHADGILQLGTTAPGAATGIAANPGPYGAVFTNTTAAFQNSIMPLFTDLVQGSAIPVFHVLTTGSAPDRICTIQWKNLRDADNTGSTLQHQFEHIEFQVKLYETKNDIEVTFGNWIISSNISLGRSFVNGIKASSTAFIAQYRPASRRNFNVAEFFDPATGTSFTGTSGYNYFIRNSVPPPAGHTIRYYGKVADDINVAELYADDFITQTGPVARNIQVLVKNEGLNAAANIAVTLTVSGANSYNETVNIASLAAGASQVVSFANFNVPVKGTQLVNVSISPGADDRADNNSRQSEQLITSGRMQSYSEEKRLFSGFGFGVATKTALKMYSIGTKKISQVKLRFTSFIQSVDVRIYEDNGTGNTPGATSLFTSSTFRTNADNEVVIPVKPAVTVDGDYYIAIGQQGTTNMGLEYYFQYPGLPQRRYSAPISSNVWTESSAGSPFNAAITVYEEIAATDVGVEALVFSCNTFNSAADTVAFSIRNFSGTTHDYAVNPVTLSGYVKDSVNNISLPFNILINTGTIQAGGNDTIEVFAPYNTQSKGFYIFNAKTSCAADSEPGNDSLYNLIYNKINITANPDSTCFHTPTTFTASNTYLTNHLWYRDPALTQFLGSGNVLSRTTTTPTDTVTYIGAIDYRGCRLRDSVKVKLSSNIPPKPVITSADTVLSILNNYRVTLNVAPAPAGAAINWFPFGYGTVQNGGTEFLLEGFLTTGVSIFPNYVNYNASGCQGIYDTANVRYADGVIHNNNTPLIINADTAYYAPGGPTAQYNGNSNFTKTFSPGIAGKKVKLSVYHLNLGAGSTLFIYDGPNTSAPLQGSLQSSSNGNTIRTFTSSDSTGVLTIRIAGNATPGRGWLAKLSLEDVLEYRTIANGNFDSLWIWESKPLGSGTYAPAARLPSRGDDAILIQNNISISRQVPLDQTVITTGASLQVLPGAYLNLYKTLPGTELVVNGTLIADVTSVVSNSTTTARGKIVVNGTLVNNTDINVDTVIMAGNGAPSVLSGNGSVQRMLINNSNGVQLNGNQLIRDNLNLLNGVININPANYIEIHNAATVSNASAAGFIAGRLRRSGFSNGTLVFPLGKANLYRPASLHTVQNDFVVYEGEMFNTAPPARALPSGITTINNKWYHRFSITEGVANFTSSTITLNYFMGDGADDFSVLRVAKGDGTNPWVNIGGAGTASQTGSITSNSFTSFSDFAIGNLIQGPLPVQLISFTAVKRNNHIFLQWTTANEINNSHFEVQRSADGITYMVIGRVNASLSPVDPKHYSFADQHPLKGNNYYRLRQVDMDNRFEYTPVRKLRFDDRLSLLTVYPNPVRDELLIDFSTSEKSIVLHLFDAAGKLLLTRRVNYELLIRFPVQALAAGIYYLRVTDGATTAQAVFLKQ